MRTTGAEPREDAAPFKEDAGSRFNLILYFKRCLHSELINEYTQTIRDRQDRGACAACVLITHTPPKLLCALLLILLPFRPSVFSWSFLQTHEDFLSSLFRWRSAVPVALIPWHSSPRLRPSFSSSRGSKLTYCSSTRSIRNACVPRDWGRPAVAVAGGSFVVAEGDGAGALCLVAQ